MDQEPSGTSLAFVEQPERHRAHAVLRASGRPQQSGRIGCAQAGPRRVELGWPLYNPADKAYLEAFSSQTRRALGNVAFERAREAGRAMPLDEVFREVRST